MYMSHREWECLYISHDLERKRVIGRCEVCELRVRLKGDLPWYCHVAGMDLADSEEADVKKITKAKWAILRKANLKIQVAWNGRDEKTQDIDKFYFSAESVTKCLK